MQQHRSTHEKTVVVQAIPSPNVNTATEAEARTARKHPEPESNVLQQVAHHAVIVQSECISQSLDSRTPVHSDIMIAIGTRLSEYGTGAAA